MQIPKEIAALVESGKLKILRHGKYQPYDILPKYGANSIEDEQLVFIWGSIADIPNDNT